MDTAVLLSGREGVNHGVVSELLVPIAFQRVARRYALDDQLRPYSLAVLTVAFTLGVGDLPDSVLIECLQHATLANALDDTATQKFTYVRDWNEFTRPLTPTSLQLGYFSVSTEMPNDTDSNIYVVEPGSSYAPGAGFTGNLTLTTPVVPTVPAGAGDSIQAPLEMQQDIVIELARMIRGNWLTEVAA